MSYYEDKIYIKTAHSCVRNRTNVVNTSSDICTFVSPSFSMSGASNVVCSATTGTSHIHMVTTETGEDFIFNFDGDNSSFDESTSFKFEIYKYDTGANTFRLPQTHVSGWYEWASFSATSAVTKTITYDSLGIDGDYLIKGFYKHNVCTEFGYRLGLENDTSLIQRGDDYGLFQENRDYYMSIIKMASKPILNDISDNTTEIKSLRQINVPTFDGQTTFTLTADISGDFIVTLNGLTLAKGLDYTITTSTGGTKPIVITLLDETKSTDVLTYIYTSNSDENANGLKTDYIDIKTIPSGPTDGEGDNEVYYNTTTLMYEVYTTLPPSDGKSIIVTINGMTLANGVDFYQSISNPSRIILEGVILIGDVITITYNQNAPFIDSIGVPMPEISWYIADQPTSTNGLFTLEYATEKEMTNIISSASTPYVVNQSVYRTIATLDGDIGEKLYYRIKNVKDYTTFCGEFIQTTAYSEVIPIIITTNSINSY